MKNRLNTLEEMVSLIEKYQKDWNHLETAVQVLNSLKREIDIKIQKELQFFKQLWLIVVHLKKNI